MLKGEMLTLYYPLGLLAFIEGAFNTQAGMSLYREQRVVRFLSTNFCSSPHRPLAYVSVRKSCLTNYPMTKLRPI